jgi:putative ABC transport system permease protein
MLPWLRRLRMLFQRQSLYRDLNEEMRFHQEMKEQQHLQSGIDPADAHSAARKSFGNETALQEASHDAWSFAAIEQFAKDIRYGLRNMRRSAGLTSLAVITLALGIGANTAIFSVVNAILLQPLPYRDSTHLVKIWPNKSGASVSKMEFVALRDRLGKVQDLTASSTWSFTITGQGNPEEIKGARATAGLFSLLGINAMLGRTFVPGEDQPDRDHVIVMSHAWWRRRFGSDPKVIGQPIKLDGENYTIIGVMPPGFSYPAENLDLWMPLELDPTKAQDYGAGYLELDARLQSGTTKEQAQAELASVSRGMSEQLRGLLPKYGEGAVVVPLQEDMVGNVRRKLLVLLGAVGLVLLIACANVANLQLIRTVARQKEIAIRSATGASRLRIIRQLLTESVLLGIVGGIAGVLLAFWLRHLLVAILPADTPRLSEIRIDWRVLWIALTGSVLTGLLFGLTPALRLSRPDLVSALKEGGRSSNTGARSLYRNALASMEIALALMIVVGAGLLIKSFWNLQHVDPGFRGESVLSMRLAPPDAAYATEARKIGYYREILQRIDNLPGVAASGAVNLIPLGSRNWNFTLTIEGRPVPPGVRGPHADFRLAANDYFRAAGIPLVRGRYFTAADNETAPGAALINESMAREYWPNEDPIGKRVSNRRNEWATIVGIVGNVRERSLDRPAASEMYRPYAQAPWIGSMTVMVRAKADPAAIESSLRTVVWSVDKDVPISDMQRLSDVVSQSISGPRSTALLISAFAAIALLLGVVGIYGVIAYSVAQRTHEIGIRMSLGAQRSDVLRLVMSEGLAVTALGICAGLLGSFAITRLLATLLFQVTATDPQVFVSVAVVLAAVALCAGYIPTRRAMKVDPTIALRGE